VVVADLLSPHKHPLTVRLIEQPEASLRFRPPYSPDLNPIEKMWSKIKAARRSAKARTPAALNKAIAAALASVTREDAPGWFVSCG